MRHTLAMLSSELVTGLAFAPAARAGSGFQTFEQGTWDMGTALVGSASATGVPRPRGR